MGLLNLFKKEKQTVKPSLDRNELLKWFHAQSAEGVDVAVQEVEFELKTQKEVSLDEVVSKVESSIRSKFEKECNTKFAIDSMVSVYASISVVRAKEQLLQMNYVVGPKTVTRPQ